MDSLEPNGYDWLLPHPIFFYNPNINKNDRNCQENPMKKSPPHPTKKPVKSINRIYIDQSGKIENTEKPTVIAVCNHTTLAIIIPAKVKRQFQEICRHRGLTRLYVYVLFAIGVNLLLTKLKTRSKITIDTEYPGRKRLIKDLIEIFMGKQKISFDFARVGNKPKVHYAAHDVYTKKKPADKTISLEEIVKITKRTDWRLRALGSTNTGIPGLF